jgi:uncharacterized protein YceK
MAFRTSCVALLLTSLPIAGCGTVVNLVRPGPEDGGKSSFGGVKQDVSCIKKAANGELDSGKHPKTESEQHPQVARILLYAADLPFTFIGDVVTWPYVVTYSYINQPVPPPPVTLAPTYPVMQAPTPSVTQATPQGRPQTSP